MDGERGTYHVWARIVWAAIDLAERGGLATDSLYDELAFDAVTVRKLRHVDWVDYCTIVERIEALAGGPDGCEQLLADHYHDAFPEIRALVRSVMPPKALLRFIVEFVDPIIFPPIKIAVDDLDEDRVRVKLELRPGARSCLAFFRGSTGALRGLPRHLGLDPAEVLHADLNPRFGSWDLRLPPSDTLAARVRRAARAPGVIRVILGYDEAGDPLSASFGMGKTGDDLEENLETATQLWDLTPRQAEVLSCLARGHSNKEIAQRLRCAENTVELHITQVLRKSRASSRAQLIARFWSDL